MRRAVSLPALASAAALVLTAALPDPRALADRLGAPTASERDAATRALADLGDAAAPALEDAARRGAPEARSRASALLARLRRDAESELRAARREAAAILSDAAAAGSRLDEDGGADRGLVRLGPAAGDALAARARALPARELVPPDLAAALARHESTASVTALAELWSAQRLLPSDAIRAGRRLGERPRTADTAVAVHTVTDALAGARGAHRRAGVALLAGLAGRDAADVLIACRTDADAGVRAEVAHALGAHAPAHGARALRELAVDPDPSVRIAALQALCRVPGIPHPESAVANADDPRPAVRRAAAALLARELTPETVPLLAALAADASMSVRLAARRGAGALRPDAAPTSPRPLR